MPFVEKLAYIDLTSIVGNASVYALFLVTWAYLLKERADRQYLPKVIKYGIDWVFYLCIYGSNVFARNEATFE